MDIKVTVFCLTYNHEKYIEEALNSFLNQETNFQFQIIVHDDASTDSTPSIIKKYANKYPDIITPIFQKENLYTKGKSFLPYVYPHIKGKYVAICEGDDYWCDKTKLQSQYEVMESNIELSACVHNTFRYDMKTGKKNILYKFDSNYIDIKNVLEWNLKAFHTSSVFFRKEYFLVPDELSMDNVGVGDYPRAVYLALKGKIQCLDKVMSVYRFNISGSWSLRNNTEEARISVIKASCNLLKKADEYSYFEFHDYIQRIYDNKMTELLFIEKQFDVIKKKYSHVLNSCFRLKMKYIICKYAPIILIVIKKIIKSCYLISRIYK